MIKNTYYYHFVINLRITIIKERSGDMDSGELLKKLRVERGISQKNLAHNITTRNTLSRYDHFVVYHPGNVCDDGGILFVRFT